MEWNGHFPHTFRSVCKAPHQCAVSRQRLCHFIWTHSFNGTFLHPLQASLSKCGILCPMIPTSFRFGFTQLFGHPPTAILIYAAAQPDGSLYRIFGKFLLNCIGIQKSILAGGSLAGYYRPDLCSCSSCLQIFLRNKFLNSSIFSYGIPWISTESLVV